MLKPDFPKNALIASRANMNKSRPATLASRLLPGLFHILPILAMAGLLAGCAYGPCCGGPPCGYYSLNNSCTAARTPVVAVTTPVPPPHSTVETPTRFLAIGHGNQGSYTQYNTGQQKLMAMRAAQVNAYRNLAEQVHGFRIWGNTTVSAFVTQNDIVRTYVDSFIRGARLVNITPIGDGNFEATVELNLPRDFVECVRRTPRCTSFAVPRLAASIVAPSAIYASP
ncbi:MAG: LPP20 family lipoprotein [Azoarcus sp.]|nr:LPP20 family lipoprotein [Azoarcus sp.]